MPSQNNAPRVLSDSERQMIARTRELAQIFKEQAEKMDAKIDIGFMKIPVSDMLDVGFDEFVKDLDKDPDTIRLWLTTAYNGISYALGYTDNPKGE